MTEINFYSTCQIDELANFCKFLEERDLLKVEFKNINVEDIFNLRLEPSDIVLVEASKLSDDKTIQKLVSLRNVSLGHSFFFCLVFDTKDQFNDLFSLTQLGCNYIYLKESDLRLSLHQLFYVYSESPDMLPRYASTKKFFCPVSYKASLFIESISGSRMYINSDFNLPNEMEINYLSTLRSRLTHVSDACDTGYSFTHKRYIYDIEMPSAWDESDESAEDTIVTHYENLEKIKLSEVAFVGDVDQEVLKSVINSCDNLAINYFDNINTLLDDFEISKCTCIVLSYDSDEKLLDVLFDTTSSLLEVANEKQPFLLIYNTKSKTEAFRKTTGYQKLLCSNTELKSAFIIDILNKISSSEMGNLYIPISSTDSLSYLNKEIVITELSETSVKFISEDEIPLGAIIRTNIGVEISLLICAPDKFLSNVGDKKHYMGLLIVNNYHESKRIRRAVNHFIYKEVNDVQSLISFFNSKKDSVEDEAVVAVEETIESEEELEEEIVHSKEKTAKDRSSNQYRKQYMDKFRRKS